MKELKKYRVILWDFDGVIMDSMPIREKGFSLVLDKFPKDQVNKLLIYHLENGGLSRYVKFKYFFKEIRRENPTDELIQELSNNFSKIMLDELINEDLLIRDSLSFIKENYKNYKFHIVSGSDGKELNFICKELNLSQYFCTIEGSPVEKKILVKNLLEKYEYNKSEVCLIGDSVNDKDAAFSNQIQFIGYNNPLLLNETPNYIECFFK